MKLRLTKIGLFAAIAALAFCLSGCSTSDEASPSPANHDASSEDDSIEYEGKSVLLKDAEIYVPADWNEEQTDSSISLTSSDNSITAMMIYSPVEGAPDHPYAMANSAKYVFTQFCAGNGFTNNADLKYEVVNGFPCYYTTHVAKDDAAPGVYSDIYVLGFTDYTIITVANYLEQEQGMANAVFSTLTTAEPASDYITGVSNSLDADTNPAELYNLEQDIKDKIAKDAEAKRAELKQQEPAIGMTEYEVLNSAWGEPKDKNVTITKYGTHEQWIYAHNRYVYFDDGMVSAVQK